jgi:hypothetical protein
LPSSCGGRTKKAPLIAQVVGEVAASKLADFAGQAEVADAAVLRD